MFSTYSHTQQWYTSLAKCFSPRIDETELTRATIGHQLLTLGVHAQRGLQYLGLSVCLSVKSHLTYGVSVRPENSVTYSAGNEGQKICRDFSEKTAFKSCATKHERKSQYANYSDLPDVSFLHLTHSEAPEGTQ